MAFRLKALLEETHRRSTWQIIIAYGAGSWVVLGASGTMMDVLGLPEWVPRIAGLICLMLLPLVVAAAIVNRAAITDASHSPAPGHAWIHRWLAWQRLALAIGVAFALLATGTTGYMGMRVMGIGPFGTLQAKEILQPEDQIVLADFENRTDYEHLGLIVTEAIRIDLSESPSIRLAESASVARALERMGLNRSAALTTQVTQELAVREGFKAVVVGEVGAVGTGFVLTGSVISPEGGQALASVREAAADSTAVLQAIDKLSAKLRERIGESLKSLHQDQALELVTTTSLEALREYTRAVRANAQGDFERAVLHLEEAVSLDTAFAMAHRKLGVVLNNLGENPARAEEALTKAFQLRDRLTERERYLTIGSYYYGTKGEDDRAIAAYRALLEIHPDDEIALNNLAILYDQSREYALASQLYDRLIEIDPSGDPFRYQNAIGTRVAMGDFDGAEALVRALERLFPEYLETTMLAAFLATARWDYDIAEAELLGLQGEHSPSSAWGRAAAFSLVQLKEVRGRLADADLGLRDLMADAEQSGDRTRYLNSAIRAAYHDALLRGRPESGLAAVESALERYPITEIEPAGRPYPLLINFFALAGEPERAKGLLREWETRGSPLRSASDPESERAARVMIQLSEGQTEEAIASLRRLGDRSSCPICYLPQLGQAFDKAAQPDSVISTYERYLATPWLQRLDNGDWYALPQIHERLGQLYEQRGDTLQAAEHYRLFTSLWEEADEDLQPRVGTARRALARLGGGRAN